MRLTNERPTAEEQHETIAIGSLNEGSLHAGVKAWCSRPGDRLEATIDGYVIDIVRDDLLIEIQTGSFSSIRPKLRALVESHRVQMVYPIPRDKWIVVTSADGHEVIRRRKSPKRGRITDVFEHLVYLPMLMNEPRFSLRVLMTQQEEIRRDDGKGSWRRKGVSIVDRHLDVHSFSRSGRTTVDYWHG